MKIGVFGGSFDPIHNGHLRIAENAFAEAGLDSLLFMPVYMQPFKIGKTMCAPARRLEMLRLALQGKPEFSVTGVELRERGVSYTIHSLRTIRAQSPADAEIYFLLGADMLLMLEKWKLAAELLREFSFIVAARPGSDSVEPFAAYLSDTYGTRILHMKNELLDVSSSDIREKVRQGKKIRGLVPKAVEEYIYENGMYKDA
ncbi:MAG: nicotinate-nucleotide adenylyltransferase [Clostridiales Family XIII bacterium]|jgi:nicotinate-nucleotide adenylyltransferase|nr:nicotinate-nucleotide adenylyltransferase [Clostridiales Family XIII bacterium]